MEELLPSHLLPGLKPQSSRLSPKNELMRVLRSKVRASGTPSVRSIPAGSFTSDPAQAVTLTRSCRYVEPQGWKRKSEETRRTKV